MDGYPCFVETTGGQTYSGTMDESGKLPRIVTEAADEYTVSWSDDALAREEGNCATRWHDQVQGLRRLGRATRLSLHMNEYGRRQFWSLNK